MLVTTLSFFLAGHPLLLAPSCPLISDELTLLPDPTTTAISVDVDGLLSTPLGRGLESWLAADRQIGDALEWLGDCGLEPEHVDTLLLARGTADERMLRAKLDRALEPETLACIEGEWRARLEGDEPWRAGPHACGARLDLHDGSRAWLLDDGSLIWARGGFVEAIEERLAGRARASDAALDDELARVDRSAEIWLASELDERARRDLPGDWAIGVQSLGASLRVDAGLELEASFEARDLDASVSLRQRLLGGLASLADRLDGYGVEHRLRERAGVALVDDAVVLRLELDARELVQVRERLDGAIQGGPL